MGFTYHGTHMAAGLPTKWAMVRTIPKDVLRKITPSTTGYSQFTSVIGCQQLPTWVHLHPFSPSVPARVLGEVLTARGWRNKNPKGPKYKLKYTPPHIVMTLASPIEKRQMPNGLSSTFHVSIDLLFCELVSNMLTSDSNNEKKIDHVNIRSLF